ncbi:hypothetical protein BDV98DRAFT_570924 [Pterulicium gracile]|uniref:Uncharacterized protein n=1 Tax=Pterulicium gracile TaxID=1884261 RepID=A0A5C3QEA6_9AGAR|nr:hypothetical protein BDV98DRAFT_570924 [Pterula gracilis]
MRRPSYTCALLFCSVLFCSCLWYPSCVRRRPAEMYFSPTCSSSSSSRVKRLASS